MPNTGSKGNWESSLDLVSDATEAAQQSYIPTLVEQLESNISLEEIPAVKSPRRSPTRSPVQQLGEKGKYSSSEPLSEERFYFLSKQFL